MESDNRVRDGEDWAKRLADADKIRLVLAGSRAEFMKWCRRVNRMPEVDAIRVWGYQDLRGRSKDKYEVVFIGPPPKWLPEATQIINYLGLKVRHE